MIEIHIEEERFAVVPVTTIKAFVQASPAKTRLENPMFAVLSKKKVSVHATPKQLQPQVKNFSHERWCY